jgi:uncharacterized protein (TIGR03067 family)
MSGRMKLALGLAIAGMSGFVGYSLAMHVKPVRRRNGQKSQHTPIEGGYTIVSGEMDGKPIPADHIAGSVVMITGDQIVSTDKNHRQLFSASYKLETEDSPWMISMKSTTPHDGDAEGLVKKEGDMVTLIYSLPGGHAPTEFHTQDKQHLFVMKAMANAGESKE